MENEISGDLIIQYSRAHSASVHRFMSIFSFRRVAELGLDAATPAVLDEQTQQAINIFFDPEYDEFFIDREAALKAVGGIENFSKTQTKFQLETFRASIDAASLVFAHSILDGVAFEYCQIAARLKPTHFETNLAERQVKLQDIKGSSYDKILWAKIEGELERFEKESLLKKTDLIFALCQPDKGYQPITDFKFDRGRLEAFDRARHDLVHDKISSNPLPNGDDDIWFLMSTSNYLMALINMRFDLKVDPRYYVELNL